MPVLCHKHYGCIASGTVVHRLPLSPCWREHTRKIKPLGIVCKSPRYVGLPWLHGSTCVSSDPQISSRVIQGLSPIAKLTNEEFRKQLLGHVRRSGTLIQYSETSSPIMRLCIASSHAYSYWVCRNTTLPDKLPIKTGLPAKFPWDNGQIVPQGLLPST